MEHTAGYFILILSALIAGMINSVAGGGTLITFPVLVALGQPSIIANATNTAALWPGSLSSAIAYRKDTKTYKNFMIVLIIPSVIGGLLGSVILVMTPQNIFNKIVPFLVLFATLLFTFNKYITGIFKIGMRDNDKINIGTYAWGFFFQLFVATYGGYFGAGIGILMLASLGVMGLHDIHQMNGLKTILGALINIIAFIFFAIKGIVVWENAILMAAGSILGGYIGAKTAKKIDQKYIRLFIIFIGLFVSVWLFVKK